MPPLTVAEPTAVAPSKIVTVSPFAPEPLNVGVATLVMLSVLDTPEARPAGRSGAPRAEPDVSMVTDRAPEATLTFPPAPVDFAGALCAQSINAEVVIV